jgi:hypothetical protein
VLDLLSRAATLDSCRNAAVAAAAAAMSAAVAEAVATFAAATRYYELYTKSSISN